MKRRLLPVNALSLAHSCGFIQPISSNNTDLTVQQTPALAVWKSDVHSKTPKLCKLKKCSRRNGAPVSLMNNINVLVTFVLRRYAVVFLRSLPSQSMHERLRA